MDKKACFRERYKKACLRAAENLTGFKRDPDYACNVGRDTRSRSHARYFLPFVESLPYCAENDRLGNPKLHDLNGLKSVGTLSYMKVVADLLPYKYQSAIEIGGGYGGQCLIQQLLRPVSYTIIDLPEALKLVETYLGNFPVEYTPLPASEVSSLSADLVISDFCLSELEKESALFYIRNVVRHCKLLYVTSNEHQWTPFLEGEIEKHFALKVIPQTIVSRRVVTVIGVK